MPKPDHPLEVKVRMALDRALECPADERENFLKWLRGADPEIAAHVLVALSDAEDRDRDRDPPAEPDAD
jgi:hypothetical protein